MSRKRPRHKNKTGNMFRSPAPPSFGAGQSSAVPSKPASSLARRNTIIGIVVGIVVCLVCRIRSVTPGKKTQSGPEASSKSASALQGTITFTRDVAPIIFQKCAGCHRPGQSAPFGLLTYLEVKKHARQIAEVTQRR